MDLMDELQDELGLQSRLSAHLLDLTSVQQSLLLYNSVIRGDIDAPSGNHAALDVIGQIIELSRDGYALSDRAVQFCRNHPADAIQPFSENMLALARLGHQRSQGIKMSISEIRTSNQSTPQLAGAYADLSQTFDENIVDWWQMMEKNLSILATMRTVAQTMAYPRSDYRDLADDWEKAKKQWNLLSRTLAQFNELFAPGSEQNDEMPDYDAQTPTASSPSTQSVQDDLPNDGTGTTQEIPWLLCFTVLVLVFSRMLS